MAFLAFNAHAVDCIRPMFEYFASHYRTEVLNLYILPGRMNPDSLHQQQKSQVSTIKYYWTQNHLDSLTFTHGCQDKVHRGTAKVDWKIDSTRAGKLTRYDWIFPDESDNFTVFRGKDSVAIVIDEEHEESYRSSQSPCYHAREVAMRRGELEGACVVLGSATPSVEASYLARSGRIGLIRLDKRAGSASLPRTQIIDLRQEIPASDSMILSDTLQEAMHAALDRKEQIMLFLNRRGYSGSVICSSCGHALRCPHCDVSLTLHRSRGDSHARGSAVAKENSVLVCHYCGYTQSMPQACPECGSVYLRSFRFGTEQVEAQVSTLFPDARVLRLDRDTASGKDGELKVLSAFAGHEADILIGTQMIVKGHDCPDVTLMGILMADLSLNIPDYSAGERTFQLLTQAAGRAGRADRQGLVLIQTYLPDHYAVTCAAAQDVGSLTAVHMSCPDQDHLILAAGYVKKFLLKMAQGSAVQILGPTDEPVARIADVWRMVLYMKGGSADTLRMIRRWLEKYIEINEGFSNIGITYETTI